MKKWKSPGLILCAGALTIAQYILAFFVFKLPGISVVQWIGVFIWLLSLVFGFMPIFILRQKGDVERGKSYVHTTRLVDTGLYAIVRHPQYLAGILFNLAMMLLAQHRLVIIFGIISMVLIYLDMQAADQDGIDKFGEEYRQYMLKVPRANLLFGLLRVLRRRRR